MVDRKTTPMLVQRNRRNEETTVMTTATSNSRTTRVSRAALVALQIIVAVAAVFGGFGLITDTLGMQQDWLSGTPFTSWLWPGIFLLIVVAVPMAVAALGELLRRHWAYAASIAAGAALVGWIVVQWLVIGKYFFLQPTMLAIGFLVVLLAWLAHRGEPVNPFHR